MQNGSFAWQLADLRAGTDYLNWMEGRTGFSKDEYLVGLETRNSEKRERCFRFPIRQEDRVIDCTPEGAIDPLRGTYRLPDGIDPATKP